MSIGYLALEIRRVVRSLRFLIFTLALPIVMFIFMSGASGGEPATTAGLMISMTTWGAFSAALFTGARVAIERGAGWQRQLRFTPLTGAGYLTTKGIVGISVALPAVLLVPLVGVLVECVSLAAGQWVHLSLAVWLGALP